MTEVYTLYSESGDKYKLQFTTDRSGIIADPLIDQLNDQGIEVVEIGLARVKGQNVTSHKVLREIEEGDAEPVTFSLIQRVVLDFTVRTISDKLACLPNRNRMCMWLAVPPTCMAGHPWLLNISAT
jgi:hypothetical protein